MNDTEIIFIEENEANLRLDQLLAARFKGTYSRTYFQKLIEQGLVLINGKPVKKRFIPAINDELEVEFAAEQTSEILPENIPLHVLYEDDDILVINKPAGFVVHPAPGHWTGTFVNALIYHCKGLADQESGVRPGIVHRLDKDTTGVLIAAKNTYSQTRLIESFSKREVKKLYLAIAIGNPGKQVISAPIGRHPVHRQKMAITESGREAISHIETLSVKEKLALVQVDIKTGRTHQIRVHLCSVGAPVLGDALYGSKSSNEKFKAHRQMLHASMLKIAHPRSGEMMEFNAPLPEDFRPFFFL